MTGLDLFETDRLILSGWRADQVGDLARLHGDPIVARYLSGHGQPWSQSEVDAALATWIRLFETQRLGKLRVRLKTSNMLVGRAGYGLYAPTGEPEIGYSLFREFWGFGYASEAAAGLRDWLFRETEWDHFIGLAHIDNLASLKVLRRIGMIDTHQATEAGLPFQFLRMDKP